MRKLLLLVSIVLSGIVCKAQSTVDKQVADKIAELRKSGIDTVISYSGYCVGHIISFVNPNDTTCASANPKYLLWANAGEAHLQKFDGCKNYPVANISHELILIVSSNYKRIKTEEIKPPTFVNIVRGKKQTSSVSSIHTCFSKFEFYTGINSFTKTVDEFYLDTKVYDKQVNVNYKHNSQTKLYKLYKLIRAELKRLNL